MNDLPRLRRYRLIATLLVCLPVVGCGSLFDASPTISYYTLTPTASPDSALPSLGNRIIAVQTVRLPDYLNQNGIVTRSEANAINVARDSQWAGALNDNITNVIVANLSRLLASTRVVAYPVSAALPVDRVVQVSQFEQAPGGEVALAAQWTIFADGGRSYLATDAGTYATVASETGYAGIAGAMSQLLGSLSHDIAGALVTTSQLPLTRASAPKP